MLVVGRQSSVVGRQNGRAAARGSQWAEPERGVLQIAVDRDELDFVDLQSGQFLVAYTRRDLDADRRRARAPAVQQRHRRSVGREREDTPAAAAARWVEEDRLGVGWRR